jgi:betaine-aldehyde dehydrogenase
MQVSLDLAKGTPLFIDGRWVAPLSRQFLDVFDPSSGARLGRVADAGTLDVNAAVEAAERCLRSPSWRGQSGADRAKLLRAIAARMLTHKDRLVLIETTNMGKPYQESVWDVDDAAACFEYYATLAEELDRRQDRALVVSNATMRSRVRLEPVGVCGAIIPFNYPLLMAAW